MFRLFSIILSLAFLLCSTGVLAQENKPTISEKMSTLGFMLGNWQGPGWVNNKEGEKVNLVDTETMKFSSDGELLIMNIDTLKGTALRSQVFVFYFDAEAEKYIFNAYSGKGSPFKLPCDLIGESRLRCYWKNRDRRFTYTRSGNSMSEIGDVKRNGEWQSS